MLKVSIRMFLVFLIIFNVDYTEVYTTSIR